jgi:hypothetical protein
VALVSPFGRAGRAVAATLFAGALAFGAALAQPPRDATVAIGWGATATGLRGEHYNSRRFFCPEVEDPGVHAVWGTDIYTDHSSICAAAVHAGVIGAEGGEVVIQEVDGLENYDGTVRNGVTSADFGAWFFSFQFLEGR